MEQCPINRTQAVWTASRAHSRKMVFDARLVLQGSSQLAPVLHPVQAGRVYADANDNLNKDF